MATESRIRVAPFRAQISVTTAVEAWGPDKTLKN